MITIRILIKLLIVLFIVGCDAKKEEVVVQENPIPEFVGPCAQSFELGCWACLYKYMNRYMILCSHQSGR